MRAILIALALVPSLVLAQGVKRDIAPGETILIPSWPNQAMNGTLNLGGKVLPAGRAACVTGGTGNVTGGGGGGAGTTIVTVTDGTNTCTITLLCTVTNTAGAKRATAANGAGNGCCYAGGAALTASVTGGTCTTTQPTFKNFDIVGDWR